MTITSYGDLVQSLQLRRHNARLNATMARLATEATTGTSADINTRLKGEFGPLAGIERGIVRAESFLSVIAEQRVETEAAQAALGKIHTLAGDVSSALLLTRNLTDPTLLNNTGQDTESRFASAIGALNTAIGGRAIFAGAAPDQPATADPETILSALETGIASAGAVTADDVFAVVDTWFGPGGGYETAGYLGGPAPSSGARLSDGETAAPLPTALDPGVREVLTGLAAGALIGRGVLSGLPEERTRLASLAGEDLMNAVSGITALQAQVGIEEGRLERADTEVRAERDSLEQARGGLIGVDPFDAATELQAVETQLRTLYAVTAQLSHLSLTEYL